MSRICEWFSPCVSASAAKRATLSPPLIDEFQSGVAAEEPLALLAMLSQQAAAGVDADRELAKTALRKLWGAIAANDAAVSRLAAWLASLKSVLLGHQHHGRSQHLMDELVLRSRPLRDQWDARGPGMMRVVAQQTEPWVLVERAVVVLVQPVLGGHGVAHLPVNLVTFEALLVNADPEIPEVVRLAWLLSQLQFDLPVLADQIPPGRRKQLAQLAMLPPALAAAEQVELLRLESESFARALLAWRVATTEPEAFQLATVLATWWQTCEMSTVAWPVAVAALDQMLPDERS